MAVRLSQSLVLLSEGDADKEFLRQLMQARGPFPAFDYPFPNDQLNGKDAFGQMLHALRGDPLGFSRLKGVLIVADSGDDPNATFAHISAQIRGATGYPVPAAALQLARAGNVPAISVMLLPDEQTPGSLESIYVEDLLARHQWLRACVDTFLLCGEGRPATWSAEKRAKATFQSIVAAIHEDDPSRAASKVFRNPPVVDIQAPCFAHVADRLRRFCDAVEAP